MTENSKSRIGRYKLEIILISLTLLIILSYTFGFGILHYIAGLKGNAFYFFGSGLLIFLVLFAVFGITIITALVNLIISIVEAVKARKLDRVKMLLLVMPFLIFMTLFIDLFNQAGAVYFLRGYEKWVQKEIDIAAIQEWLVSLDPVYSGEHYFEAEDFPEDLPEAIKKLNPYHMYFSEFEGQERSVEFEWGCALSHFGIRIGLEGMETPGEERKLIDESQEYEYTRPIQSGVYIFDRG